MSGLPNKHTLANYLKVVIPLLVVIGIAFLSYSLLTHNDTKEQPSVQPTQQEVVHIDNERKQTTTFEYLPKSVGEDTDVQFETTQKPLVVNVNGQRHEIATDNVKEDHKLDNGKLVVTETHEAVLDLRIPEQPKFKKGIYVETDLANDKAITAGARLSYQTEPLDIDLKADLYNSKEHMKRITLTATKWL